MCGKECDPGTVVAKVEMSFDYGDKGQRLGASEWDDKRRYCGVPCLTREVRQNMYNAIRLYGEE